MMQLEAAAPAKTNLFLDVLGRREDGYHEIRTVFAPLDAPADTVRVDPRGERGIGIACEHPHVPTDESNLCWRAARLFADATGCDARWRIEILKAIPVAAGLGGGSSDAAAVLRLLNDMHGLPLTEVTLRALALALGADVPFFLQPRLAVGEGIGERLRSLSCPARIPMVLLNPGFPSPVVWAYRHHSRVSRPPAPNIELLIRSLSEGDLDGIARQTYNALEWALCDKFPLLRMLMEFLLDCGFLAAHVCGSGPTVYGIGDCDRFEELAQDARERFGEQLWARRAALVPFSSERV